jgi:S-adenosylmethionine decarboxylase
MSLKKKDASWYKKEGQMSETHDPVGYHYIVEASGCNPEIISSVKEVREILVRSAEIAGAQVRAESFYQFPPQGVSGVVVISESHISIHTWPENGYAAIDIYTCGSEVEPEQAIEYAVQSFQANQSHITEITRGLDEGDDLFYHSIITWEEDHQKKQTKKKRKK